MMTHNLTACLMCRTPCYPNMLLIYLFSILFPGLLCQPKVFTFMILFCPSRLCTSFCCFVYPDVAFPSCCFVYSYVVFPLCSCLPRFCIHLALLHLPRFGISWLTFSKPDYQFRSVSLFLTGVVLSVRIDCMAIYLYFPAYILTQKTRLIDNTIKLLSLES